ncbi:MAG: glycosyltransferase [Vicinamibacterales bacterium]
MPETAPAWAGLRVAIVHDWLTGMRGGEKVLESICRLFPDAPVLTLVHRPGTASPTIARHPIRTAFVQRLPLSGRLYRYYLPVFPAAVETFDLDEVDLVISTSHCAVKSVVPTGRTRHLCYCHSPMRYAWDQFEHYFGAERVGRPASAALRPVLAWLARWDRATAGRVDRFLANSQHVAGRIARYYDRQSAVVYPPVDTEFFTPGGAPGEFVLVVSALVPYKRLDIAIRAAQRLKRPLKIVGTGPDRARLESLAAGRDVEFLGAIAPEALRDVYRGAQAVLMPGEEDFGIVPVEAMACGRPVVALDRGGARESVLHGETGFLVGAATAEAFAEAVAAVPGAGFSSARIRRQAERFSVDRFEQAFAAHVAAALADAPVAC